MKTISRNLLSIVRRFRVATVLNVFGLSFAFAAFMTILMQVDYERNFDRCHPEAEHIFRVDLSQPGEFSTVLPRAFVEAVIASSPHIEAGTLINPFVGEVYFTVVGNDGSAPKNRSGAKAAMTIARSWSLRWVPSTVIFRGIRSCATSSIPPSMEHF